MKFTEFNLPPNLLRAIESCNYTDATAIQEQTIPALMNGQDIIGQSQTGTGKTAAFALPILAQCVPTDHKRPQALILSPTRELALQIVEHFRQFTKFSDGIRTVAIYGGQPIDVQIRELKKGGDIIVGTPGRIQDHIRRKTLRFENLNYLVLDEADEMLQMGFKEEIEEILKSIPETRTTALFSATMPKAILDITENYMKDPKHISISPKMKTLDAIEQMVYEVPQPYKVDLLLQLIALYQPTQAMIFCNTKKMVDDLAETLQKNHLDAAAIHGDMKQEMRTVVMNKFKKQTIRFLIATDVAARGIDVDSMEMVINYDLPQDDEYYIHRIGRTGRAGSKGQAITIVSNNQRRAWDNLVRFNKLTAKVMPLPTQDELDHIQLNQIKKVLEQQTDKMIPDTIEQIFNMITESGMDKDHLLKVLLMQQTSKNSFSEIVTIKKPSIRQYRSYSLNIGERQGVSAAKILRNTEMYCGIDPALVGKIKISRNSTLVEVASHVDPKVFQRLKKMGGNQKVIIETLESRDRR